MPTRPTVRDLLVRELERLDFERRAVAAAIVALMPEKPAPPRPARRSPVARRRPAYNPHTGSRKLREDVYAATLAVVRDAGGVVDKPSVRRELRRRHFPVSSVDYHLIRAVKRGDVKRHGSGYIAREA